MKHSLKILIGSLTIAALSACGGGGGGGGSSSSDPGAAAGYVGAAGANGTIYNVGYGVWSGNIIGQNVGTQQYQMFMYQYGRGSFSTLINLRVWSKVRGMLPDTMGFAINGRNSGGDAFSQGNGFLINNYQYGYGYGYGYGAGYGMGFQPGFQTQCYPYPCNNNQMMGPGQNGTPVVQIVTQFVNDPCHNTMTALIRYQGVVVAQGQLTSEQPVQFRQIGYGGYPFGYPGQPMVGQQLPPQCYMQNQQMVDPNAQTYNN